ncbi:MAG: hypothetical protein SOX56_01505 [[Pasteurella] mairii]|uniref:Uncharacterized protein n=1 Tax=[Pasteurella] mairii TaxID=757 RepID=A0A379B4S4_9PAST|nr:hypothetical protein [[Pasteurella] mairii]SUB33536.1 Uncharacterised protein [[Pasteurella] mairii]
MANSNTEHSKKLRLKTSAEWNKKQIADGKIRQISLKLETELANEFDAILSELGNNRSQGIKALCEFYRQYQKTSDNSH